MFVSKHILVIIIRGLIILYFGVYTFDLNAQHLSERTSSAQLIPIDSSSTKNNTVSAYPPFSYKYNPPLNKVLNHVVGFNFKKEVTSIEIKSSTDFFLSLSEKIPEIIKIEWGENLSKQGFSKGVTHCFNLTFASEKARNKYLDHEAHHDLVARVRPLLEDIVVMEFWLEK